MGRLDNTVAVVAAFTAVAVGATALPAAAFVTPVLGMDCDTSVSTNEAGNYQGVARCTAHSEGFFLIEVSCKYGLTSRSKPVGVSDGDTKTVSAGDCWFGVAEARILESDTWASGPYHSLS
ncbi:hypothetical protein [Actinoplanes sp. L3-i22]|uniref:hypothetical protein n=1 Tax=Actinoplanes sp. L3-i22 TaxID=2836373 RepID=UPI001C759D4D|nr:hypothetical protein [Actinoplanes sp. L3-i22]BCY08686.1 hypothetical protein L3i22_037740 [Actinoplanes sp. L3-i22]